MERTKGYVFQQASELCSKCFLVYVFVLSIKRFVIVTVVCYLHYLEIT